MSPREGAEAAGCAAVRGSHRAVAAVPAGVLGTVRGLFVEARPSNAVAAGPTAPIGGLPTVAVLCGARQARAAASAVALALGSATGRPCALAGALGAAAPGAAAGAALPVAAEAARRLRDRGQPATACGRLVWLLGREVATGANADLVGVAAGASAALGRAATAVTAPAAIAIPLARSDALDRVLRWFDGFVVVRAPVSEDVVLTTILASLGALGRPVAVMPPLGRVDALAAKLGLRAPAAAHAAVAALELAS